MLRCGKYQRQVMETEYALQLGSQMLALQDPPRISPPGRMTTATATRSTMAEERLIDQSSIVV